MRQAAEGHVSFHGDGRSDAAGNQGRGKFCSVRKRLDYAQLGVTQKTLVLLLLAVACFRVSAALAQASNYTSIETTSGTPIRLGYHASAHKNCTPAQLPAIKVSEPPKAGALVVRKGTLATDKVPGCGLIRVPVQVVFYNPRDGYVGPDHVQYEVTNSNGQTTTYDITVTVKATPPGAAVPPEAPSPPGPAPTGKPGTKI
jgi:hypothetical protein